MRALTLTLLVGMGALVHALTGTPALAQPPGRAGAAIPTLTRYVKQFGELESELMQVAQSQDGATIERLLSPMFECRNSEGARLTREAWIHDALKSPRPAGSLQQLVVFETGNHAVANFRLQAPDGSARFIVDVWAPTPEGHWQLRVRFESPSPAASQTDAVGTPHRDAKPDGKR